MVSFVQFLVIVAAATSAYGEVQNLTVTNSAQDYFLISQRELFHDIELVELQIAAVDDRYADRLDVISYQHEQVLHEIHQVNQTLMPLQALSVVRKHCIQSYDSKLVAHDSAKTQFKRCHDAAEERGITLTLSARSNLNNAKNYVGYDFPKNVANCDSIHAKNQTGLEKCYITCVDRAGIFVNHYLEQVQRDLIVSLNKSLEFSRTAVQCSFAVERDTLEKIGQTTESIDECVTTLNEQSVAEVENDTKAKSGHSLRIEFI